jgi:tetratricopeptide (TPR) repeat protein
MPAARPYYIASLGINIYSIEELCYLISQNAHTLDHDFMEEELCSFIRDQLKLSGLADVLKGIIRGKGSLTDFIMAILEDSGYCDADEIRNIKQILVESAGLSPSRKHKNRGDNLLRAGKFIRAMDEYKVTLGKIDQEAEPILYASVLHNMATAYARLMLYDKAAENYREAYRLNMDNESLKMYLLCCRLYMEKADYDRMLIKYGYSGEIAARVEKLMATREDYRYSGNKYALELNRLKQLKEDGMISRYYEAVEETIEAWKWAYRMDMMPH